MTLKVLKQEIVARTEDISNMNIQHQTEITILKQELLKTKETSRELSSKHEQIGIKAQHSETKIKNLERSLSKLPNKSNQDNLESEYK
jgi:hypothetical protein